METAAGRAGPPSAPRMGSMATLATLRPTMGCGHLPALTAASVNDGAEGLGRGQHMPSEVAVSRGS